MPNAMTTPPRAQKSDWLHSLLRDEIMRRCPMCGQFENNTPDSFEDHHINGDCSETKYWNMIRLCKQCHNECDKQIANKQHQREVLHLKKNLFRNLIGPASYDVLLQAYEKGTVLTFPHAARTLLERDLVTCIQENPGNMGMGAKPSFSVYEITEQGKQWAEKLNLSWKKDC